jgi:photosystem II stability/assembly factor-like uncharacterized protein
MWGGLSTRAPDFIRQAARPSFWPARPKAADPRSPFYPTCNLSPHPYEHIVMPIRWLTIGLLSVLPVFGEGSCWLRDAASPAPSTVYALCEQGTLWITTDGGAKWTSKNMSATTPLRAMTFLDSKRGIAVGDGGTILGTDDGGISWSPRPSSTKEKLMDVTFAGESGWASGMNGALIATTDGGKTWAAQKTGTTQALEGIFFLNATHGWAVGWAGTILRTVDAGKTWQKITAEAAQWSSGSIYFRDEKTGWAAGFGGQLLRSDDGGATWKTVKTPVSAALTSIAFDKSGNGWITYDDGFLTSADGGLTWKPVKTEGRYFLSRLLKVNDTLWAIGQSVVLRQTGPTEWQKLDTLVPNTAMQGATLETTKSK